MNSGEPNIRAIAKRSGFSRTTVSLALRNHPKIPEETREKIKTVAKEMGYRPNPMVSVLMSQLQKSKKQQSTIGFLISSQNLQQWRRENGLEMELFEGARKRAADLGYELEPFSVAESGMTSQRLNKIL